MFTIRNPFIFVQPRLCLSACFVQNSPALLHTYSVLGCSLPAEEPFSASFLISIV